MKDVKKFLLVLSLVVLFISGCGSNTLPEVTDEKLDTYSNVLDQYYDAYGQGNIEKIKELSVDGFSYEEAEKKYDGVESLEKAIAENEKSEHKFTVLEKVEEDGRIKVTLENTNYFISLITEKTYKSYEFFEFENDKISVIRTVIDKDDYNSIMAGINATPGVILEEKEGRLFVKEFLKGSAAEENGMKVGAEILSINGVEVSSMKKGANEANIRLLGEPDTKVIFIQSSDGVEERIELTRFVYEAE